MYDSGRVSESRRVWKLFHYYVACTTKVLAKRSKIGFWFSSYKCLLPGRNRAIICTTFAVLLVFDDDDTCAFSSVHTTSHHCPVETIIISLPEHVFLVQLRKTGGRWHNVKQEMKRNESDGGTWNQQHEHMSDVRQLLSLFLPSHHFHFWGAYA